MWETAGKKRSEHMLTLFHTHKPTKGKWSEAKKKERETRNNNNKKIKPS